MSSVIKNNLSYAPLPVLIAAVSFPFYSVISNKLFEFLHRKREKEGKRPIQNIQF